jgi:3-hydroxyacyl-[acyl-carrier-protein] dehydratase
MAAHSAELHIRADEPATNGHFPGNPIVPGATLLREIVRILSRDGEAVCCGIHSMKFFRPVRPGDRLTFRWEERPNGEISLTCSTATAEHRVLSGTIRMRAR